MKQKTLKKLNRYAWIMGLLAIVLMLFGITTELDFKDPILTIIIILAIVILINKIIVKYRSKSNPNTGFSIKKN